MSKQMSREEAVALLEIAIGEAYNLMQDRCCTQKETNETKEEMEQRFLALSILAPEPRTEPPGVDEVGDADLCLNYEVLGGKWNTYEGRIVRDFWQNGDAWLPYSALPMPKGTP